MDMVKEYKQQLTILLAVLLGGIFLLVATSRVKETDFYIQDTGSATKDGEVLLHTISVSGDGVAYAEPDVIRFSVTSTELADTTREAQERVNERMAEVLNILRDGGVDDEDIQTTQLSLYPEYDYFSDRGRELIGQRASQSVSVTVRDIGENGENAGELVDQIAGLEEIQLSGISFDLDDKTELFTEAREVAFEKAEQKAEELADLGGVELLKPVSIRDGSFDVAETTMSASRFSEELAFAADLAQPTEIAVGQLQVSVRLDIDWGIK